MKAIALKAGVSVMTVSRALRDQPCLPETTRRSIQQLARDMGYRPNPMVSALMAQLHGRRTKAESPVICYITAYPDPDHWKELPYNVAAFNGAAARARELGYRLEHFCITEPGMTPQTASRILRARGVAGLLLAPLPNPGPGNIEINWEWFACATIGFSLRNPVMHRSMVDHFAAMRLAYSSLRELGYRRIGMALRPMDDRQVENKWVGGYLTELYTVPPRDRLPLHLEADWTPQRFRTWLLKHKPDAIITMHPQVIEWTEQCGISVPGDIGVALPDLSYAAIHPGLSGVDQQTELVGAHALDLVVEQIHHNQRGIPRVAKVVMVRGNWMQGKYVRPQPVTTAAA